MEPFSRKRMHHEKQKVAFMIFDEEHNMIVKESTCELYSDRNVSHVSIRAILD